MAAVNVKQPVILVPLDGSNWSERAVDFALALRPPDGELLLLRVVRGPEEFEGWWVVPATDAEALVAAEEAARESLASLADRLSAGVPSVRTEVVSGDPADEILRTVRRADVSLMVMSTHGRVVSGRLFFGSVADRVTRYCTCPVLLLRSASRAAATKRVIVPLDGSLSAEEALPLAVWASQRLDVPVRLVRVVESDEISREIRLGPVRESPERQKADIQAEARARCDRAADAYLSALVERLRALGTIAEFEVRTGSPALVLLDLLRADDLAVMTSQGLGGMRRWLLGSVAEKLVRSGPCPILLVPIGRETTG